MIGVLGMFVRELCDEYRFVMENVVFLIRCDIGIVVHFYLYWRD